MTFKLFLSAAALLAAATSTGAIAAPAQTKPLAQQTRANLMKAMEGEAFANLKYLRYADQAETAGNPELAKLFRANANVEANEHFDREAQALNYGSPDTANLADAIAGELYENTQMYIGFAEEAEAAGDLKVAALFRQTAEDEGTHYQSYKAALAKITDK